MDWFQVIIIVGSTLGGCWLMCRESTKMRQEFSKDRREFYEKFLALQETHLQLIRKYIDNRK